MCLRRAPLSRKKFAGSGVRHLKLVVKDNKTTMTADATGVRKITVNFSKAVDTANTKVIVKKNSATPTISSTTFAADAKSVELTMGTKLTEGTYTVEATVGEDVLTYEIAVKDETMTSFFVSPNLIATADSTEAQKDATISYKALNQYGEMMTASNVSTTCSFGTVDAAKSKTPTADAAGKIYVKNINTALAIPGTTGTVVIVNIDNGVNKNETVTYQSKAVATSATVYGVYSTKNDKLIDGNLATGTNASNYALLINVKDQYESDMTPSDITGSGSKVTLNPASVLTDLTLANTEVQSTWSTTQYDGATCILVPFKDGKITKAGTLSLTIVSAYKGTLATPSIVVDESVLVNTFSVSAKDTVYEDADNELIVDVTDVNGNKVTTFDALKGAFADTLKNNSDITIKKNADGSGTFVYHPAAGTVTHVDDKKYDASTPVTKMFYANDATSGKYIVTPVSFKVYEKAQVWKVAGTGKDTVTALKKDQSITFDFSSLTFENQFGNTISWDDKYVGNITYMFGDSDGAVLKDITTGTAITADSKKITLTGKAKGTATMYLKYKSSGDGAAVSSSKYDTKITLSVVDANSYSDIKVEINNGKQIFAKAVGVEFVAKNATDSISTKASNDTVTEAAVKVTAKVNGKTVVIPTSDYTIITKSFNGLGSADADKNKTEERTLSIVVQTADGPQQIDTKFTMSNVAPKAVEIKGTDSKAVTTAAIDKIDAADIFKALKIVDQYGNTMTSFAATDFQYTVEFTGTNAIASGDIDKNMTQNVTTKASAAVKANTKYTATVTYKMISNPSLTTTVDVKITTAE